jgi:PleD family two-component response regulator
VAQRRIVVPVAGRVKGAPVRREPVSVTISLGYAACEDRLRSAREVLKAADQALYVARTRAATGWCGHDRPPSRPRA